MPLHPIRGTGTGAGGAGGSANVGVPLFQRGENDKGLFISHRRMNYSWALIGAERAADVPTTQARLTFNNAAADGSVAFDLPEDWETLPEDANNINVAYTTYPTPVTEVKAFYDYGPLRVTSAKTGAAGNSDQLQIIAGTAAVDPTNATARLALSTGFMVVKSPDAEFLGTFGAGVYGPNNGDVHLNIRAAARGRDAGNVTFTWRVRYDPDATGVSVEITRPNPNSVNRIIKIIGNTETVEFDWNVAVAAINAYRESETQVLVATIGDSATSTIRLRSAGFNPLLVDDSRIADDNPTYRTSTSLSFGENPSSGAGSATNVGEVRLRRGGTRVNAAKAFTNTRAFTVLWKQPGVVGNGKVHQRVGNNTVAANTVEVTTANNGNTLVLTGPASGSVTTAVMVAAVNDAGLENWEASTTNGNDTITFPANGSTFVSTLGGGVDAAFQLAVTWDPDIHQLLIDNINNLDNVTTVRNAILALSEFAALDVTFDGGAQLSSLFTVPSNEGDILDYNFSGGSESTPRSTLEASITGIAGNFFLIIRGVLATDTVAEIIAIYTGITNSAAFTLSATPGDSTAATVPGTAVANRNLANGLNGVSRQLPSLTLSAGAIAIGLHAAGGASDTTLNELVTAFRAATYIDVDGDTQTVPSADVTTTGTTSSVIGVGALPISPAGGVNMVSADPITAIIDEDDMLLGPHIEVRIRPSEDTLDDVLEALKDEGEVSVVELRGTDLTARPENVPFTRHPYQPPGTGAGTADVFTELTYWQDPVAMGETPADEETKEVYVGRGSYNVQFEEYDVDSNNRYIHIRVPIAYVLSVISWEARNRLETFVVTTDATYRYYHSRRLTVDDRIDLSVETNNAA